MYFFNQPLGTKKITQPLRTKKITQPLGTKKITQLLWIKIKQATSWDRKNHLTSYDKKNHATSQDKNKCIPWGQKNDANSCDKKITQPRKERKSRIRETKHLLTDADSSTDTTVGWTKNTQKPKFFEKRKKLSKMQKLKNV